MSRLLILLAALSTGPIYPPPRDDHVNDFAEVLAAQDVERIRAVAQAALRERSVPIVVATIPSLAEYDAADWSIERYATNLYNEWGIGDRATNRGVLLLVSVRDRKLRIATGAGLGNLDGAARQVIDGVIVPRFKAGDLPGGIASGVETIAKWFQPAPAGPSPVGVPPERVPGGEGAGWTPHGTRVIRNTEGGGFSFLFKIFLFFIGVLVVLSIFRRRPIGGPSRYGGYGGSYGGGWGRFLLGGVAGFLGSQLFQGSRHRSREWGSGGSLFGGGSGGSFFGASSRSGGGSSFSGGFSSGGGASGSW